MTVLDTCYGLNDPGVSILSNGELLLRTTLVDVRPSSEYEKLDHPILAHRPDLCTVSAVVGQSLQRSKDFGKTWSPYQLINLEKDTSIVSREPVIELEDNTLLLSCYKSKPTQLLSTNI